MKTNPMFKFNKKLSLFKSARLVFENQETPQVNADPRFPDHALTPAEHKAERAKTTREILEGVKRDRAALSNKQATNLILKTKENPGDKLLMEDTYVLIAQKGTGSKHNERGWKGLALKTDFVKVLDPKVKLINGVEMVKVKLSHKLYSKPGTRERYRTYIGYVPKKAFDPSVKLRNPESPQRKPAAPESAEKKLINAKTKFQKLFNKYKIKDASYGTSTSVKSDNHNVLVITYCKSKTAASNGNLITVTIDTSKDTFDYTVNGQHTRGLDAALRFAESILKREVGSPKETEE